MLIGIPEFRPETLMNRVSELCIVPFTDAFVDEVREGRTQHGANEVEIFLESRPFDDTLLFLCQIHQFATLT